MGNIRELLEHLDKYLADKTTPEQDKAGVFLKALFEEKDALADKALGMVDEELRHPLSRANRSEMLDIIEKYIAGEEELGVPTLIAISCVIPVIAQYLTVRLMTKYPPITHLTLIRWMTDSFSSGVVNNWVSISRTVVR